VVLADQVQKSCSVRCCGFQLRRIPTDPRFFIGGNWGGVNDWAIWRKV